MHLSIAKEEYKERSESEKWHRKLVGKYLPEEVDGSGDDGSVVLRDWCKDEVFREEYIRNNLCRHLVGVGLESELDDLLRNPKCRNAFGCSSAPKPA